ncbi:MAG: GNAT family N-acetyltransferase, partial [Nocardiopsaceae bacterium]|nr:GNAT family N-acetyltransferase [Nocardiopsaceae bacterium]
MTDVEIRPLGPDDDLEAQADLGEQAFGGKPAAERERWMRAAAAQVSRGAFLGAFADGRPVGAAKYHDMRQWWHGRAVPLAGVADVKVAPEYGGRGIGTRLMTRLLDRIADRGYPVAALYPATMPIYRSLGWELAGACYQATVPSRELRSLLAPDPALAGASGDPRAAPAPPPDAAGLRRATPDDAAEVAAVLDRVHQAGRHNGPLTRDDLTIRDWLSRDGQYVYLAADGILGYQWDGDHELFVERVAAASPAAGRALWALLASQSSMVRTVRARLAPDDPLWWLTRERDVRAVSRSMWMLRIVDAPAAIAARGFPPSVSLSVRLNITDPARPSNDGR